MATAVGNAATTAVETAATTAVETAAATAVETATATAVGTAPSSWPTARRLTPPFGRESNTWNRYLPTGGRGMVGGIDRRGGG